MLAAGVAAACVALLVWAALHQQQTNSTVDWPFRIAEQKFASLADAIGDAVDGDTIEVTRDSKIFLEETLVITGKSLRIVAGTQQSAAVLELSIAGNSAAISSDAPLVIEGAVIKNLVNDSEGNLITSTSDLSLLNCRLTSVTSAGIAGRDSESKGYSLVKLSGFGTFNAVNCEFYAAGAAAVFVGEIPADQQRILTHRNCGVVVLDALRLDNCEGDILWIAQHSFFAGRSGVLAISSSAPIQLHATMDHCFLGFKGTVIGQAGMTRSAFRESSSWQGDANLYANSDVFLKNRRSLNLRRTRANVSTLTDWIDFWGRKETRAAFVVVSLRDQLARDEIPENVEDIDASLHLQLRKFPGN
ncbi:MAG: hypothetical protein ACI9R3_004765 [Verrucomicrobiales bacterium]